MKWRLRATNGPLFTTGSIEAVLDPTFWTFALLFHKGLAIHRRPTQLSGFFAALDALWVTREGDMSIEPVGQGETSFFTCHQPSPGIDLLRLEVTMS